MGENVPGYGLGLNLARELARLHHGDLLSCCGRQDDWTEFEVRFRTCARSASLPMRVHETSSRRAPPGACLATVQPSLPRRSSSTASTRHYPFNPTSGRQAARLSGTLDLEGIRLFPTATGLDSIPAPASLQSAPLRVFLDAQSGRRLYAFSQVRFDRGFDPSDKGLRVRIDEFALLRMQLREDGRLGIQLGQFCNGRRTLDAAPCTSWENPFITAPLAYEHLTAMWDSAAARSTETLLRWGHLTRELDARPGECRPSSATACHLGAKLRDRRGHLRPL
jgi:hypothetical protein